MQLFSATVKYPAGKTFESKYGNGQRQNVVITGNRGDETVWFPAGHAFYCSLQRGDRVQVFNKGSADKPQWRIVEPEESEVRSQPADGNYPVIAEHSQRSQVVAVTQHQARTGTLDGETMVQAAKDAALYRVLYDAVCLQFQGADLPVGELTKFATTMYIQYSKK